MAKKLEQLRTKRNQQFAALTRIREFVERVVGGEVTEGVFFQIESRFQSLRSILDKFDNLQSEIETEDQGQVEVDRRIEFENAYYAVHALSSEIMSKYKRGEGFIGQQTHQAKGPTDQPQVSLPQMTLPTFNGEYDKWLEFRDTFMALVGSNLKLSGVQKFYHLKSCLHPEVLETIKAIPVSDENYGLAWQQLTERYEKKHLISSKHVNLILNFPKLAKESSQELRNLHNCIRNNLEALRSLGAAVEHWDLLLIPILTAKLDSATRREWERLAVTNREVSLSDLVGLISTRCEYLERFESQTGKTGFMTQSKSLPNSSNSVTKTKGPSFCHVQRVEEECQACGKAHQLFKCDKFLKLEVGERLKLVRHKGLCLNCLKTSHYAKKCQSTKCRKCGAAHNSLLHAETKDPVKTSEKAQEPVIATTQIQGSKFTEAREQVILPTAVVLVMDSKGKEHRGRVLLDSGAMSCFITRDFWRRLGLKQKSVEYAISGVGQTIQRAQQMTKVSFKSVNGISFETHCIILDTITAELPLYSFHEEQLKVPKTVKLADPLFNRAGPVDMLLGSSIFWELLQEEQMGIPGTKLTLHKTKLGWIIGGRCKTNQQGAHAKGRTVNCLSRNLAPIEDLLKRFWEVEEVESNQGRSSEDQIVEELFVRTHHKGRDGHYIVQVPFRDNVKQLGSSREFAIKRFKRLEHKLSRDPSLSEEYKNVMREYLAMGHMKEVNEKEEPERASYYIPHHAVVRDESLTTKTRVVFDASMATTSGLSLNQVQYVGPTLQRDIFSVLVNFRLHKYILSGDISKMYRMIWLDEEHKPFHRIFWREAHTDPMRCFELQTVTFGTASAPFLAIRCLHQVAEEYEREYPEACRVIRNNFYVDDLIYGAESVAELVKLQHQITKILSSVGFQLRKWLSNESTIYNMLELDSSLDCGILRFGDKDNKALGVSWCTMSDRILYSERPCRHRSITKRMILSEISKIFDPLGLLGPVLISGKLLMQSLWQEKSDWDEVVSPMAAERWDAFKGELHKIHMVRVDRKVVVDGHSSVELHGFCDASERAYGASLYVRSRNPAGMSKATLLCAKSKVAPLRCISLPKLELCGAVLLARLIKRVMDNFEIAIEKVYCWTDSTITLAWIRSEPSRWKTFVANRVSEIQSVTETNCWHHVSSTDNPCDVLSRGTTVELLMANELWWSGPQWLAEGPWPEVEDSSKQVEIPERRARVCVNLAIPEWSLVERYSSFMKLIRVTALCLRFKRHCQSPADTRSKGELTAEELKESSIKLVRVMQRQAFPEEYKNLSDSKALSKRSRLLALNPFLDEHGVMRVGGRVKAGELAFDSKHPIILEPSHRLTKLLVNHYHWENFHCGPTALLAAIRQKYWPLNARNLVKGIIRQCTVCFLANPKPFQYIMGQLPKARVTQAFPFENVGVDYAGPVLMRDRQTRNYRVVKAYICVFVCLATKAIHLELVTDLTSENFLSCLKRFISRRGKPLNIYSDNGRNFVGANAELKKFYTFVRGDKTIDKFFANQGINWHFIPARSPTFGGIWEAGVKIVKRYLVKIVKNSKLHYEQLATLLCQIEAVLNSRPLTPLTSDPEDLQPLTPGHFLIGRSLCAHSEPHPFSLATPGGRKHYESCQQLLKQFWKRWKEEYLVELQTRSKWKTVPQQQIPIRVGQMVVVIDAEGHPYQWPLGRVVELHPGPDGVARVASVRIKGSVVKRGIRKLCALPDA